MRDAEQNARSSTQQTAREALAQRDELTARRDALRESLASARDTISQTTYKIDSLRTLLTRSKRRTKTSAARSWS